MTHKNEVEIMQGIMYLIIFLPDGFKYYFLFIKDIRNG